MTEALLACLAERANAHGVVLVQEEVLFDRLGANRDIIAAALAKLEDAGLVEVFSPPPFIVVRLKTWPGRGEKSANSSADAYSSSKQLLHSQRLNSSHRPAGVDGPVDKGLLSEILDTLGETDATSFVKAVELYSPHVIRLALDRVRRARGIRKSRTALFRHLLPRLARENQRAV